MDEVIKIEIPRQQDNGFIYIHLDKDKTIQISRDTLSSLTMDDLLKRIEKIDKTLNDKDSKPKVSLVEEGEFEKDEPKEWAKIVKDQILDAKVVSKVVLMENQKNNGMYKFALVSSDFYNFSDILLKVDKKYKEFPCEFVANYNHHLSEVLNCLNKDLSEHKISIHLVDTYIIDDYTSNHLGEPKITMYCFADLPKQTDKVTHSLLEYFVKIHNYENYGQYGHIVTLRELIKLLTDSEDSKIDNFWKEQEMSKVMKGRLKNGENEEWEYRC